MGKSTHRVGFAKPKPGLVHIQCPVICTLTVEGQGFCMWFFSQHQGSSTSSQASPQSNERALRTLIFSGGLSSWFYFSVTSALFFLFPLSSFYALLIPHSPLLCLIYLTHPNVSYAHSVLLPTNCFSLMVPGFPSSPKGPTALTTLSPVLSFSSCLFRIAQSQLLTPKPHP